jgi:FtsP/CotA-like multicopper oxidase with cupredoxin domain
VRARITNTLADSTIHVFGWHRRPAAAPDSLVVRPGDTGEAEFEAGEPGTYLYHVRVGSVPTVPFGPETEQLIGAFVVDPPGGSPPDRILVINIWSREVPEEEAETGYLEALTINGKSWPHTELLRPEVGELQRWRVVNGSVRNHPMHLHGFYFDVTDRADLLASEPYTEADRRAVVTEFMRQYTTMDMEWTPTRPGTWVFHCHLSFHISPETRLPGADALDHHHAHMAGLVLGIEVPPGPSDIVERYDAARLTLHALEYADTDTTTRFAFSFDPAFVPDSAHRATPGPVLLMRQYQPTYVTVRNHLGVPTGVHWHGLELDAWSDGVPGWSASDGKMSPVIAPDTSFTYKLSALRPGTFIYHTHLNDIDQLTRGLYGPLIVLGENESFDPATDHVNVVGWRNPDPDGMDDVELNGTTVQPEVRARVGETHRIRVINIAPAGNIGVRMTRGDVPVAIVPVAKDGADLPAHQQVPAEQSGRFGVGETADFAFTPAEPGTYTLHIGYSPSDRWQQTWTVTDR